MEKVSILIPTHNRKELLKNAVNSAIMQTYPSIEIIVIDDKSDYDVKIFLKEYLDKIKVIKNSENLGSAETCNVGIKKAKGDFITILNDDDIFHPKKVEKQIKIMENNPEIGLVYCPIGYKYDKLIYYQPIKNKKDYWKRLTYSNTIGITPLLRKECIKECGEYDTSLEYHEDRELWYRIGKKYKFGYVNEPLYIVYNHDIPRLSNRLEKIVAGKTSLFKKHKNDFKNNRFYNSDLNFELSYEYLRFKKYKIFFHHMKKAVKNRPLFIFKYLRVPKERIISKNKKIYVDNEIEKILS